MLALMYGSMLWTFLTKSSMKLLHPEEEKRSVEAAIRESWQTAEWQKMDVKTLQKAIDNKRKQMLAAAKATDFEMAARLRDEMLEMQDRLQAIEG